MSRRLPPLTLAALAWLLAAAAPPVAAKELRLAYADELEPLLALAEPRFDRMQGVFRLSRADSHQACPGASIRLVDGETVRPLAIADDGRVDLPIDQGLADRDAQLWLEKPDDAPACRIFTNVTARLPAGRAWRYRDLSGFAAQLQAYLERSAGLASLFAPELRGLSLRFGAGAPARLVIHAASGDIVLQASAGQLRVPIEPRLAEENPRVSLSADALAMDGWLGD